MFDTLAGVIKECRRFLWQKSLSAQQVHKFAQYGGVITPWAQPLVATLQISMEHLLREIGDLKTLYLEPLAQSQQGNAIVDGRVVVCNLVETGGSHRPGPRCAMGLGKCWEDAEDL